MQKRLKALSHDLRFLWPGNWLIRRRLLTAGVALGLISLLMPLYTRSHLQQLVDIYSRTSARWQTLDQIHEMSQVLTDIESKLRAYAASRNHDWIASLELHRSAMDEMLKALAETQKFDPDRTALVHDIEASYRQWQNDVVLPLTTTDIRSQAWATKLAAEPGAFRIHQLLSDLARDIRENTMVENQTVAVEARKAVLVVTYNGVIFLCGFIALMVSLWYTIIPDLGSLMSAARELKRGNLDHRVHIDGKTESAHLGRAFNEMAVSLQAQNAKLQELNRVKNDFVSTVSHELRTPLTAIKGSIGLILGGVTGTIPPETADMLKITQKNTDRLIRLINEVLDIAKIEAGHIQMHFDKHSLVDTISHAVMGIEAFAQTQGIKLDWEKPQISPLVVADRDRLEQVLTNLLSNAIKFTEPGGKVTVRAFWESDRVVIEVSDTGEGIPEEFLERIFEKFQQATNAVNHQKEGTGLGLAIARAIVEEHGGSIWVSSKVAHGSTFAFSLPWNGTEFVEIKKPAKAQAKAQGHKTILIIDNEPDFTTVLSKWLEHEGYSVLTAATGKAGIELALKHHPDLVISDVMMPEMDGFEVSRCLAENPETKGVPVAFATISPDVLSDPRVAQAAVQVFTKPIVSEDFKSWLKQFFTQSKSKAA